MQCPRRLVLHIGTPKSGTTYLQSELVGNAEPLRRLGVLVPLASEADGPGTLAFRAALDLTGKRMGHPPAFVDGYWSQLVEQVEGFDGDVVVSHEAFVRCTPEHVARVVAELASGHELHVVVTARNLARSLISAWLEGLKHGTEHDLAEHFRRAEAGTLPVLRAFDLPEILGTWVAAVPPARVHLVTVPSASEPGTLWERFCAAAGLDPGSAPHPTMRRNESVGAAEAQLLLALNRLAGAKVARGGRWDAVKRETVISALTRRSGRPVGLGGVDAAWTVDRARAWTRWVEASGVSVVGCLDDLVPDAAELEAGLDPAQPHAEVAQAAAEVVGSLLELVDELGRDEPVGHGWRGWPGRRRRQPARR